MQGAIAVLNLLIAEDERFTREGLYYEIDWNSLGIGQVKLAENGLKALNIMDTFIPDILLADVRMPKMNGIDLAYRVKTINPDCSVIFMSGYSDKEYLLSAIEINALNYVEKPLNIDEVIQSLKKAVEAQYNIMKKNHYIESELANKLSYRGIHNQKDVVSYSKFIPALHDNLKARTILLTNSTRKLSLNANFINKIPEIKRKLKSLNLDSIIGIKDNQWLMIHIFYDCILESNLIKQIIYEIYRCMESILDLDEELYLSLGKTVSDIFKIYASFESANSALDNIFFFPKQKIHCYQETKANANSFDMENIVKFASYLKNGREQDSIELIKTIKADLCNNSKIDSSTAKNIFLSLFMELGKCRVHNGVLETNSWNILHEISQANFIDELENLLILKTKEYFKDMRKLITNPIVSEIISIINRQYSDPNLSLNKISEEIYLSSSYVCVLFKEVTNKTIVQYINEFRIEKSLELLRQNKYRIKSIAAMVGFEDSNYFSKTFKKIKGISPNEYRKRFLD